MSALKTTFATVRDEAELIDLQRAVGGGFAAAGDFGHWYGEHPFGEVTIPVVRSANGSLIGAAWIFPMRVSVSGGELLIGNAANLHVHPSHRDTFAYPILSRHLERTVSTRYPLHVSLVSSRTYERQKQVAPRGVVPVPWLLKVLDPAAWAESYRRAGGRLLPRSAVHLLGRWACSRPRSIERGVRVTMALDFDERFDDLWRSVRDQAPVTPVRSADFLRWRFRGAPSRSYATFIAEAEDRPIGYLVLRAMKVGAANVGYVVDLLLAQGGDGARAAGALVQAAQDHAVERRLSVLATALTPLSREARLLVAAGFRSNPLEWLGRLQGLWPSPLRTALFTHDADRTPQVVRSASDWYLTLALHETI